MDKLIEKMEEARQGHVTMAEYLEANPHARAVSEAKDHREWIEVFDEVIRVLKNGS